MPSPSKLLKQQLLPALIYLLIPLTALAQGGDGFGIVEAPTGTASGDLLPTLTSLINIGLALVGIIAAVFLIIGGVRYITSQGDEGQAETAKKTILYAIIGLLVIGLAAAIVNFVIGAIGKA